MLLYVAYWNEMGFLPIQYASYNWRYYLQQKVDLQMSFSLNKVSYFPIIIPQSSQRGKSIHLPPCGLG